MELKRKQEEKAYKKRMQEERERIERENEAQRKKMEKQLADAKKRKDAGILTPDEIDFIFNKEINIVDEKQNNFHELLNDYNSVLHSCKQTKHVVIESKILNKIGILHTKSLERDYEQAIKFHEKAHIKAIQCKEPNEEINCFKYTGNNYMLMNRKPDAIKSYNSGLEVAVRYQKTGKKMYRVDCRRNEGILNGKLGQIYDILGDVGKSLDYHLKDLEIAIESDINDKIRENVACTNVGNIYELRGQYKNALSYFEQALLAITSLDDIDMTENEYGALRRAHGNVANMYYKFTLYEKALLHYEKDLYITRTFLTAENDNRNTAPDFKFSTLESRAITNIYIHTDMNVLDCNIGITKMSLGLYKEALELHKRDFSLLTDQDIENRYKEHVLDLLRDDDVDSSNGNNNNLKQLKRLSQPKLYEEILQIYINIGDVHKEMMQYDVALEYYFDSLDVAKRYDNTKLIMLLYECLSKTYIEIGGRSDNAYRYAHKALTTAIKINDQKAVGRAYGILAAYYRKRGSYQLAIEHFERSIRICEETNQYAVMLECKRQLNNMNDTIAVIPTTLENMIFEEHNTDTKLLLFSAENGCLEYIKRIYNNDIMFANYSTGDHDVVLNHDYIHHPNMSIVRCQEEEGGGYNILSYSNSGLSIIHVAAINGHLDIIEYMIFQQHANPFAETNSFETALELSLVYGHHHITKFFIDEYGGMPFNYTKRLLLQRKRREDHLFACKWYYPLMFPKRQSLNLPINIKTSWVLLCLFICLIHSFYIAMKSYKRHIHTNKVMALSESTSKINKRSNYMDGNKYKVTSISGGNDTDNVSIDVLLSDGSDLFYRYFNVSGMKRRIAPREEGDIYDQTWKSKIKTINRKEKNDNDFDFDRNDLGNSGKTFDF
eukprot:g7034.t1